MSSSPKGLGFSRKDAVILFFGLVGISLVVFFLGLLVGRELSTYSVLSQLRPLEEKESKNLEEGIDVTAATHSEESKIESTTADPSPLPVVTEVDSESSSQQISVQNSEGDTSIAHLHVGKYTLQVALLPSREEAAATVSHIRDAGFPSVYMTPSKMNNRDYYTIDVGRFPSEIEAQKFAQNLLKQGVIK